MPQSRKSREAKSKPAVEEEMEDIQEVTEIISVETVTEKEKTQQPDLMEFLMNMQQTVYQIAYVTLKAANSPRPGTWILERSIDGITYQPWQYFARSDKECFERFGITPTKRKPKYYTDSEVICTSFYSTLQPLENGEVHVSLIHGRPGANETSPELLEFTKARFVRMRFMGLRGNVEPLPKWLSQDLLREKRLFYSIRDITIGGQCVCNGHAESCRHNVASGHPECECGHHTCGPNCDRCCPMYNQRQWGAGTSRDAHQCLPCNCHGHATSCHYDQEVDRSGQSMDIHGNYQGGGVCDNCTAHTTGYNCERCLPGYHRPQGVGPDQEAPCVECDCHPAGSAGTCVEAGAQAGTCNCLTGYAGKRCDECAPGYRGFPKCEICPCDPKGVMDMGDCEGECICKANVDGQYCDHCKPGYFGLRGDYQEGCAACFCSGVTTVCESAEIKPKTISILNEWLITDLGVSKVVVPSRDDRGFYSIGNYELPGTEALYWLAPEEYVGNTLESYSSYFTFKVHWTVMRGDTSGEPTTGPNIIIIGHNGMKIAQGNDRFKTSNMTFNIKLNEPGWFHISSEVKDIVTRPKRTEYKGSPVSRRQFLSVLVNIKHILLRATFHTDQIEGLLEEATMSIGKEGDSELYSAVEKCSCPSGYSGLSCESCSFGYVRILVNNSNEQEQGFCAKCDCNGHSETCVPTTGECFCQHNTTGDRCERCAPGFYGNPLHGTPADCRRCACPLENDENNFSPSCQLDYYAEREEDEGGYVCTQCPLGYTGDHCEICDDGFYGNPMTIGNSCEPCECNGGPCDSTTGLCLSCKGNTEGFRCERCKPGYYGDPENSDCKPCQCDILGSLSNECDITTGGCLCKERFTGRICDKCEVGYGNVTAFCAPCACNPLGSVTETCDQHTGLCTCRPGVEGFHCDACQNFYYGFGDEGCKECACDKEGSLFQTCDEQGYCRCRPHFVGKQCDRCKDGYWKRGPAGCVSCECNLHGAISNICDKHTGKCTCQPGIGGDDCSRCDDRYFGNLTAGCQPCEPCNKKGHICDPNNGKCVCPPFTSGIYCDHCVDYAWGYEPGIGCKDCECSRTGSSHSSCNDRGVCLCKPGFEGEKCDRCAYGYFGYPNCEKCNCNAAGRNSLSIECDPTDGQCQCKANVIGQKCDQCMEGTFGLDKSNHYGCTKCFCFGRSTQCTASNLSWYPIRSDRPLEVTNDCKYRPPCWLLPTEFTGDLTTSYGGYLEIVSSLKNSSILSIYMTGNGVTLNSSLSDTKGEVILTEHYWDIDYDPDDVFINCQGANRRECYMSVLQDITEISVESRAGKSNFASINFKEILLYNATNLYGGLVALTVERCSCPPEYTSLSCQDPSRGYYRYFPNEDESVSWIDTVIGLAKPCECNGHSQECDRETGQCLNCADNTAGPHCEYCAEGHYEHAGLCLPCECPSAEKNFASRCMPGKREHDFTCICKKGYTGKKCDSCEDGYFGNPEEIDGSCTKCKCHPVGGVNNMCDRITGMCRCKEGFTGPKCNYCNEAMTYIENGVCTPCDECSQLLFKQIDDLSSGINSTLILFKNGIGPPWQKLNENLNLYITLSKDFNNKTNKYKKLLNEADMNRYEDIVHDLEQQVKNRKHRLKKAHTNLKHLNHDTRNLSKEIEKLTNQLDDILRDLENFGTSHINVNEALAKAKEIYEDMKRTQEKFKSFEIYKQALQHCNRISSEVNRIYNTSLIDPSNVGTQLNDLRQKLSELNGLLNHMEELNKETKHKNDRIRKRVELLKQKINKINDKNKIALKEFKDILDTTDATRKVLKEITDISKLLMNEDFDKKYKDLEDVTDTVAKNIEEAEDYRDKVLKHVMELENSLRRINSTLNFTKEEWKKIEAGESYENIKEGVKEAKRVAKEAKNILERALMKIEPDMKDSIVDNASIALAFSDRLKRRIENLNKPKTEFFKVANDIEKVKQNIHQNGKSNNELTKILRNMREEMAKLNENDFMKIEKNANEIINRMENIDKEIDTINYTEQHDLFKNYNNYLNLTFERDRDNLSMNLTRQELDRIDLSNIDYIRKKNDEFSTKNPNIQNIEDKINELRNKIKYARQLANAVELPLQIKNCSRTFRFQQQMILYGISIRFVCSTNCRIFNISSIDNDYLSLTSNQTKDGSRILILDVGNDEQHTEKIAGGNYPITLELLRNNGYMLLRINSSQESVIPTKSTLFIGNKIAVGGTDYSPASIQRLYLNDKPLGLWNFQESEGQCTGTYYLDGDKDSDITSGEFFFGGSGYRFVNVTGYDDRNRELLKNSYSFTANFGTFDNDSLLILAQDIDEPCLYFTVYLKDGKIEMKVQNRGTSTTISPGIQCNDGSKENEFKVAIFRKKFYLGVNCNDQEKLLDAGSYQTDFRTKKANYYIGGVPPPFFSSKNCVDTSLKSYLGFLQPFASVYKDPSLSLSHDVTYSTNELNFRGAVFKQDGYLHFVSSKPFDISTFEIDFIILPNNSRDGQLMQIGDFSISIMDNNVVLKNFDETLKEVRIKQLHYNKVSFTIDVDEVMDDFDGDSIYFGKVDDVEKSFTGEINFININNRPIYFNKSTVKEFRNVDIGRHVSLPLSTPEELFRKSPAVDSDSNSIKDMQRTESCSSDSNVATDPGAVKFGDKPQSFIYIQNPFWKKDYEIEFLFRTFYPNGVLFTTIGNQHQNVHYYLLEVRQGKVLLHIRKGKKKKVIAFTETINNGIWHHLKITHTGIKKRRKLTIALDNKSKKPMRVPKVLVRGEVYIGGTPLSFTDNGELRNSLIQFRGCMKDIRINKFPQVLVKNKNTTYSNIGQCFPHIEEGAYFGGDAYAIYKSDFRVNQILELSFEFRTTEQNGIILSVSNQGNTPALSVELQNGAVVMSIDMGNGVVPNVTKDFDSEYALCNNRWHNVTALYSSMELTINVDGIRSSWVLSELNSLMHEIEAPLYIGGLPDNAATGTLKIRENFKGCIRKLVIEEKLMDWTDMERLNNVLLNSCPVSP